MKQENKILVWAVFILLIAIVSFNFTGMTGEYVKNRITTVSLDNTYVMPGDTITLTIVPGSEGVKPGVDIYIPKTNVNDERYLQSAFQICRSSDRCKDITTVKYKLMDGFAPGTYYFRLKDEYSDDYVKAFFTVGTKYYPVPPKKHT